jgi:GYF domain 2
MPDAGWSLTAMLEEWIIRVQGKEYGPADAATLLEWKADGRVLPENEVRRADVDLWMTAAEIPGLFETAAAVSPPPPPVSRRSFFRICAETLWIYYRGFWQFLCLTLLVFLPSLCGQLTSAALEASTNVDVDLRTVAAGAFALCMLILKLTLWPVYIAGIQVLAAEIAEGRRVGFLGVLNEAIRFWPRIAALCILVYGAFALLLLLAAGILLAVSIGASSPWLILLALALLIFQVWMFGRLFINVLFWQQAVVFEDADAMKSLRRSKQLALSGRDRPWFQRPLWRGALIVSLWTLFVLALETAASWSSLQQSFHTVMTSHDTQALIEALKAAPKSSGEDILTSAAALLQAILRPLLGIAFVLLYFDSRSDVAED